ncbi:sialidase family protein [Dokdonella sp.]|uniref:sialidase family protein n=1 Tax=Dokdonella sp. TaxID=2291710 RepID=UPI002F3E824F
MKLFASVLAVLCASAVANAAESVTSGDEIDYMPSVIRSSDDGARIVVFERLSAPPALSGDLLLTRSTDDGATWSTPVAIVATSANERHPSLLQLGPSSYALFYLKGTGGSSTFRLWRATSADGIAFLEQSQLDLGWATGGEVNPHVIRHPDGMLTMSYQRLPGGSYVAQSSDGGATWDQLRTPIAAGSQLPRIAFRASDGLYLASYQVGSSALSMYVKTTTDVHDWSAAPQDFAVTGNNHDSLPVVMPDDAFALFWIRANGDQFDLAVRRSSDGLNWSNAIALTDSPDEDDVEPHPLVGASPIAVELYWGRDAPAGSLTHDIVREPHVVVVDAIFADGLDPA